MRIRKYFSRERVKGLLELGGAGAIAEGLYYVSHSLIGDSLPAYVALGLGSSALTTLMIDGSLRLGLNRGIFRKSEDMDKGHHGMGGF